MVALYLDTSAVVKLYLDEPDSIRVEQVVSEALVRVSSMLTYVEAHSALGRRFRDDRYPRSERTAILDRFERDWHEYSRVEVSDSLVEHAAALSRLHHLRAYDAVHLASVLTIRRTLDRPLTFVSFDAPLNRAAKKVGLTVFKG